MWFKDVSNKIWQILKSDFLNCVFAKCEASEFYLNHYLKSVML